MVDNQIITFIGPGVMAEGMISGIIRHEVVPSKAITAAGPRQKRLDDLNLKYSINVSTDNVNAVENADVVILSIKPQSLDHVMNELNNSIQPGALILSIIAGAPIRKISNGLNHAKVVRSMPNTPAQIGKEMARQILLALGDEIFLEDEAYLDMATAVSGTGPAYVFLFMEAMVDAGVHLGFPRRVAERLVAQTVRGSVDYYQKRDDPVHLARLRNQVTSPGGTSAEALYYLEKAGFRTAISRAIWAAFERSQELGEGGESHPPKDGIPG